MRSALATALAAARGAPTAVAGAAEARASDPSLAADLSACVGEKLAAFARDAIVPVLATALDACLDASGGAEEEEERRRA